MPKLKPIKTHSNQKTLIQYRFKLMLQKLKELSTQVEQFGLDLCGLEYTDDGDYEPKEE